MSIIWWIGSAIIVVLLVWYCDPDNPQHRKLLRIYRDYEMIDDDAYML